MSSLTVPMRLVAPLACVAMITGLLCAPSRSLAQSRVEFVAREGASGTAAGPINARGCATDRWTFRVVAPGASGSPTVWLSRSDTCARRKGDPNCVARVEAMPVPATCGDHRCFTFSLEGRWLVDPVGGSCDVIDEGATRMFVVFENTVVVSPRVAWDTLPPAPPTALEAQRGAENEVRLTWNYSVATATDAGSAFVDADVVSDAASDDRSPVPDDVARTPRNETLRRFWVLCEPAAAVDAGAADGSSCASGGFEALDTTREDSLNRFAAQCGLDGGVAASTTAVSLTALQASQQTRFAVVAEDRAGNRSAVAIAAACVSPERYTDFWEQYRQSGGTGAATCGASPRSLGSQRAAWLVVLGVMFARARRKRQA